MRSAIPSLLVFFGLLCLTFVWVSIAGPQTRLAKPTPIVEVVPRKPEKPSKVHVFPVPGGTITMEEDNGIIRMRESYRFKDTTITEDTYIIP